jgi:hypothetical protein
MHSFDLALAPNSIAQAIQRQFLHRDAGITLEELS